jgi:ABC-type antimicrobial peptide transport system permease subunit
MQHGLNGYSFHISIEPGLFIISGTFALVMAILTVSCQAIKAAQVNPVTSLKSE